MIIEYFSLICVFLQVAVLFAAGSVLSAPAADPLLLAKPYINQGSASGPLTPAVGDLVATPKGYKSIALEGFSEDLNQDGFVDPIGQAVAVHAVAAPAVTYAAAPVAVKAVAPVEVKAAEVKTVAAPAVTYAVAAPAVHHVAAPAVTYAAAAPVACAAAECKTVAAPAVTYAAAVPAVHAVATAPVVQHVGYQVHHQVHHVPQVSVQKHVTHHTTQHVINHAPVVGAYAGLPIAAPAAVVETSE